MIQIITYSGSNAKYNGAFAEQYSFHDVHSLDEYDINVIDLNEKNIWYNDNDSNSSVNCIADLKSLSKMIMESKKSKIIILLPQNMKYSYYYTYTGAGNAKTYTKGKELKNMLETLTSHVLSALHQLFKEINLVYENTKTRIAQNEYTASFYFSNPQNTLLTSEKSEKATTIEINKIILSTLKVDDYESVVSVLKGLNLIEEKETEPEWMSYLKFFDDVTQEKIIDENREAIEKAEKQIQEANIVLDLNKRLKSILYTNGNELVEVVFEIIEELLGIDLSAFIDEKEADFEFEIDQIVFVGEIKGVNHNVKNENVSQLDVHYQGYLDKHEDIKPSDVVALLIMNHQKNKPLSEREPVKETQINLAKRNGSLIIETPTLLKLLENYRNKTVTREQVIRLLKDTTGKLTI